LRTALEADRASSVSSEQHEETDAGSEMGDGIDIPESERVKEDCPVPEKLKISPLKSPLGSDDSSELRNR